MILENLKSNICSQLLNKRFRPLYISKNNKMENYYIREDNPILYVVAVSDDNLLHMEQEFLWSYGENIFEDYGGKVFTDVIMVSIFLGDKPHDAKKMVSENPHIHYIQWYFDTVKNVVTAEDGQPTKLIGLEKMLMNATDRNMSQDVEVMIPSNPMGFPKICAGIFMSWVIVLIYVTFDTDTLKAYNDLGISRQGINDFEYYRFITSMFVHDEWTHLLSNSIYLYYFGARLELLFGSIKFIVIYLLSGLTGGLLSVLFTDVISIGASGGTYGLLGAMLAVAYKYGSRYINMSYSTLLMLGFISITAGFFKYNVNNIAHMGGLVCGMYFGYYFIKISPKYNSYTHNNVEK